MSSVNPSDAKTAEGDVSIDLPAPTGWKKKFTPKKGTTPGRNEIVFIAPDGEEIKSRAQLRGYLKSHSADVTFKEFDWSTGDTPRRSSRLSGKSKVSESPDNDTPRKKPRKLNSKKEKDEGSEDEATNEGGKEATEALNDDAKDTVEHDDKDVVTEKGDDVEDPVKGDDVEDPVKGDDVGELDAEEKKAGDVGEPDAEEEKAGDVGEPDAEEEKAGDVGEPDAEEEKAASEEQKTDAMEHDAAAEEEKSDVKENEAAVDDEQIPDVKEHEAAAAAEEKADVIEEEAVDMDVLLGTNDNEVTELEIGDMKKEGGEVSESKQSNREEKGVENAEWTAEDWSIPEEILPHVPGSEAEGGPSDFLAALPDDFLADAFPKVEEETADPRVEETNKESSSKDEAENQTSVGNVNPVLQEAEREENQEDLPK